MTSIITGTFETEDLAILEKRFISLSKRLKRKMLYKYKLLTFHLYKYVFFPWF